jgi:gliding motility-associated-like protein
VKIIITLFYFIIIFIWIPSLKAQIPTNGLVAYYPFNGNANDESGNGNNGIVYGAKLTTDRCGILNRAYSFDNLIPGYISIPSTGLDLNQFTYSSWAYLYSSPSDNERYCVIVIGSLNGDHAITYNVNFHILDTLYNGWGSHSYSGGSSNTIYTGISASTKQWYHLLTTRSLIASKFYINGILVDSVGTPDAPYYGVGPVEASIGMRYNHTLPFDGKIDDIRIYNRALSEVEIKRLYNEECNISQTDSSKINGIIQVCQGQKDVSYNVQGMNDILNYSWTYSGNGAIFNGNSSILNVDFADNASSGNLMVLGYKKDGFGIDTAILSITVNSCNHNCESDLLNGLVAYYPFNSNANDESGNGNNGAVFGASLTTDRCGNINQAYYFNGIDNYIFINPGFLLNNSQGTFATWVKFNDLTRLQYLAFVGDVNSIDYYISLLRYDQIYHTMSIYTHNPRGGGSYLIGNTIIAPNVFYHMVMTSDGLNWNIYINGVKENLISLSGPNNGAWINDLSSVDDLLLGAIKLEVPEASNAYLQGILDDIRIYNRALSEDEIRCLYYTNCSIPQPEPGAIDGITEVCQGQKNVNYKVVNMDSVISYSWSYSGSGATLYSSSDIVTVDFANNATSGYLLVTGYKTGTSIIDTALLSINVNPLPSAAGSIFGEETICQNQYGLNYYTLPIANVSNYIWDFSGHGATIIGNSDNITINYANNATNGSLTVYGINLCGTGKLSEPLLINLVSCDSLPSVQLNIPNTFSPNGDGQNDFFLIRGLTSHSKLIVFDRYGREIYVSDNYQNNWDGKDNKGQLLESDTYWYVLSVPGVSKEFKGFIYIKR